MKIPASADEVTPEWLSDVLDADVKSVEVVDAHSGTTGRAKIRIESGGDLPDTLFVKLQPFDAERRAFLAMIGRGVSAAKLYAAAGDELPVRAKVWHFMVLEDLEAVGCPFATPDDDDVAIVELDVLGLLGGRLGRGRDAT